MRVAPKHLGATLATLAAVMAAPDARADLAPLEPYQMVRSLQLVQDRIADGDHAALPMQRKLIELIDERLRSTERADYDDKRNVRALLIYAMSGGNPRTVERIMSHVSLENVDARLSTGMIEYLRGHPGGAAAALKDVDPRDVAPEVSAFLALIKGSIVANDDPAEGLNYLDMARLLGPGTLVEEAALRRSITLSVSQLETERFLRASEQYVRRFLRSPYASQFADAFVAGIADLHETVDLDRIATIIAAMNADQGKVVYLRLARRAAIDQHTTLLAFARAGLEGMAAEIGSEDDPRAILYSTVAAVTTDDVDVVRARLNSIDHRQLSAGDRMLLDAALRIVDEVTSQPEITAAPAIINEIDEANIPNEPEVAMPEVGVESGNAKPEIQKVSAEPSALAESERFIDGARKQLESIDKMLQETK